MRVFDLVHSHVEAPAGKITAICCNAERVALNIAGYRIRSATASASPFPVGLQPTGNGEFYKEWAEENAKAALTNINASLGQMLTLSALLLGAWVTVWNSKTDLINDQYRYLIVVVLLLDVLWRLRSTVLEEAAINLSDATVIKAYWESTITRKASCLRFAKLSLFLSLATIAFGVIVGAQPTWRTVLLCGLGKNVLVAGCTLIVIASG